MNFSELKQEVRSDWAAQAEYRDDMRDDFRFFNGHQWTAEERAYIENETGRAAITFNRAATVISAVAGAEINNRTEVRFIPREIGDAKPNEVLTAGAQWWRDESDAEDEESHSFQDMLICGIGFTETWMDWENDPDGRPMTTRINPIECGWDRCAHDRGLRDSRRFFRVREMSKDDALEMFEGEDVGDIHCSWIDKGRGEGKMQHEVIGDEYRDPENETDAPRSTVTVVQVQYRQRRKVVEYMDPTSGEKDEMPKAEWDRLAKAMPLNSIKHRVVTRPEWKQVYLGNDKILRETKPCEDASTITAMTAHWDEEEKRFYGLLQAMRDPQKYANKWLTQTLHIINTNAKGGVMAEEDAVQDIRQFEDSYAASDEVTWVAPGAFQAGKIQPKPQASFPQALMQLTEQAITSIRDVPGVSLEMLGMADRNQAGVLEYQRRQSAMTTLAFYFDALRYYRKRQGRVILEFLQNWVAPTGRLVRIQQEGMEQYVPLAVEDGTMMYDVIVDDAPSAPNEKERSWSIIEKMLPVVGPMMPPEMWARVMEYSPLPSSLVEELREMIEQQGQQAEQSPEQQIAIQKEQADIEKTKSETEENRADAQKTMAEIQQMGATPDTGAIKAQEQHLGMQMNAQKHQQEMTQRAQKHALEMATRAKPQPGRPTQGQR